MKKNAGILLILVLIIQSCTQSETITAEEAKKAIQRFDLGWENKKAATVDSLLGDNYVYFTQSGGTFDRANVVKTAASTEYKIDSVNREIVSVQVTGNMAVVNSVWRGIGVYYGQPFDDRQRCSIILMKHDGKVEIISEHCTLIK